MSVSNRYLILARLRGRDVSILNEFTSSFGCDFYIDDKTQIVLKSKHVDIQVTRLAPCLGGVPMCRTFHPKNAFIA